MDIYSGIPYWIAKNGLNDYSNPLRSDHIAYIAIIGAGITGALVAHELCSIGIKCTLIEKNELTKGSTAESTATLQYEIATPLSEMVKSMPEESAVLAYKSSLQAISDIEKVFQKVRFDPDLEKVCSISYAHNESSLNLITKEYEIRKKYKLPVNIIDNKTLFKKYGIKAAGALETHSSAQIDTYKGTLHLIDYHMDKNELEVFTHTEIKDYYKDKYGYILKTANGFTLKCQYVVFATGYETGNLFPHVKMDLASIYAIISKPIDENYIWNSHCIIRSMEHPYFSIRTDNNKRIIVSGEEEEFDHKIDRNKHLPKKAGILEGKIKNLFSDIPFKTDMAWYGTISYTRDRLPCIGTLPKDNKVFYAFGYGKNGITYSMIAAQMIRNKIKGIKDKREAVFGFSPERKINIT